MRRLLDYLADHPGQILAFCAAVFLLLGWGQDGISLDSATYAVIARNMAETGSWFNPHYTHYYLSVFTTHPPLVMWIQGLIFLLVEPNDSTARLFGALCTFGSVLMVYLIGRQILNKAYAFLAGLTLLLTYNFMQIGNSTLLDVPMTFFILVTLWGIVKLQKGDVSVRTALITGAALGCAWLSKGVVSAPVWIALAATCLIWNRQWFRKKSFWLVSLMALGMIATHLLLDQAYTGGQFRHSYLLHQVRGHFLGGGPDIHTEWWQFTCRFAGMYLPFSILLPFGFYLIIKRRMKLLYPAPIALLFYFLFYSASSRLYYHYFCPAYALAALPASLPLWYILKEHHIRRIAVAFLLIWIAVAVGVKIGGVHVHEIRMPEIYALTDVMHNVLEDKPNRDGITIGQGRPNWGYVARTAWYWRSSILRVSTVEDAVKHLKSEKYAYILIESDDVSTIDTLSTQYADTVTIAAQNDRLTVYVLSRGGNALGELPNPR